MNCTSPAMIVIDVVSGLGGIATGAILLVVFIPRLDRWLDRREERRLEKDA